MFLSDVIQIISLIYWHINFSTYSLPQFLKFTNVLFEFIFLYICISYVYSTILKDIKILICFKKVNYCFPLHYIDIYISYYFFLIINLLNN